MRSSVSLLLELADKDRAVRWRALFRVWATKILATKALVDFIEANYFDGQQILWQPLRTALDQDVEMVSEIATQFDGMETIFDRLDADFPPHNRRSEVDAIQESIDVRACAKSLIDEAKIKALTVHRQSVTLRYDLFTEGLTVIEKLIQKTESKVLIIGHR